MNERIKKLAIEARLIVAEPNGFDQTRLSMSQQKFAQLIVKECADICTENSEKYKWHTTPMKAKLSEQSSKCCAILIKRTFGVEE
jgi:hypothetical protein